jgi:acyl carrier protein
VEAFDRLQKVFRDTFNDTGIDVDLGMSRDGISTIYGWDSIKHVELMYKIENEFNIDFSLEDLQEMKTIGDMLTTVRERLDAGE